MRARLETTPAGVFIFLVLLVVSAPLVAGSAGAQEAVGAAATGDRYGAAIDEAVAAFEGGRWLEARAAFARAHAIAPSARTFRGLGLASFYLKEPAAARAAFESALRDTRKPLTDQQRSELTTMLAECARSSGRFTLEMAPDDTLITVDGVAVAERTLFPERGEHAIVASADGFVAQEQKVAVSGGEDGALRFALVRAAPEAAPSPLEPPAVRPGAPALTAPTSTEPATHDRFWTWIALGAVPVFASTAAIVWFSGEAERDSVDRRCRDLRCNDAQATQLADDAHLGAYETWTSVSLGASALSLIGAGALFLIEGDAPSDDAALSFGRDGAVLKARL